MFVQPISSPRFIQIDLDIQTSRIHELRWLHRVAEESLPSAADSTSSTDGDNPESKDGPPTPVQILDGFEGLDKSVQDLGFSVVQEKRAVSRVSIFVRYHRALSDKSVSLENR